MAGDTVIIGIGDERRRDDGVGIAVARALAEGELPAGVRVEEAGREGFDLLAAIDGTERVIILAAMRLGDAPGAIHVLSPADAEARANYLSPLGTMALADALELALMIGSRPEVLIVGVEPAEIVPGHTLNAEVAAAVQRAAGIARELAVAPT